MANGSFVRRCLFLTLDTQAVQSGYTSFIISITLNIISAVPAVLVNALVITAILRTKNLHTPSNLLLCSLALTDLGVGMVTQPSYVAYKFAEIHGNFRVYCGTGVVALVSSYIFAGGSYVTLTSISIDRYLALRLGVLYRSTVTTSRVTRVLIGLWLFSVLLGTSQLYLDPRTFIRTIAALMVLCLVVCISAYTMAYRALRHHQIQVASRNVPASSSLGRRDINKYRKSLKTMVFILTLILISYVPYLCVSVVIAIKGLTPEARVARNIASPILFSNSGLNPIVYIVKIREIRHACIRLLGKALFLRNAVDGGSTDVESTMHSIHSSAAATLTAVG